MDWHSYLVFGLTFIASVFSGMASGGGAYVVTPLLIAVGLTPQQSIATSKLWAIGMDSGSITAYRSRVSKHKQMALALIIVAIPIGIIAAWGIRHLPGDNLKLIMGILNLVLIPVLFIKHREIKSRRRHEVFQALGFLLVIGFMILGSIFSAGTGGLISVVLIAVFGIKPLETNLIKRKASLISDVIILLGLIGAGLINIHYGIIVVMAGIAGGYIGSKFALREGEKFARYALMVLMLASGIWLITTA